MNDVSKTNAMRLLDAAEVEYEALEYPVDVDHLDGEFAADKLGLEYSEVYKTLVTHSERDIFVCLVPVNEHLSLKKLAKAANVKKLDMIAVKDIMKLTGYVRGGCSPIGMKKSYPTFIHEDVILVDNVAVSAGDRGKQIYIKPEKLIEYCDMTVGDFIQ